MQFSKGSIVRAFAVAGTLAGVAGLLTACGGSSGPSGALGGLGSNNGYVRIINGSPDDGSVDVFIDGNNKSGAALGYGGVSPENALRPGSHTVDIYPAGDDTQSALIAPQATISTNSGQDYTIVVTGEKHPTYQAAANIGIITFTEESYSTPSGGGAVNLHHAAPFAASATGLNASSVQFGYYVTSSPANNAIGSPVALGGATNPFGLPANAIGTPLTLYAIAYTSGIITTPDQVSSNCTNNSLPCGTPNLSLYLVDGPAASTTPDTTLPAGISASAKAVFFGLTDPNGTYT